MPTRLVVYTDVERPLNKVDTHYLADGASIAVPMPEKRLLVIDLSMVELATLMGELTTILAKHDDAAKAAEGPSPNVLCACGHTRGIHYESRSEPTGSCMGKDCRCAAFCLRHDQMNALRGMEKYAELAELSPDVAFNLLIDAIADQRSLTQPIANQHGIGHVFVAVARALQLLQMRVRALEASPRIQGEPKTPLVDPPNYQGKVRKVFEELCLKNGAASPADVTAELGKRGWLSEADSVLDIAHIMEGLGLFRPGHLADPHVKQETILTDQDGWLLRDALVFAAENNYGTPAQRERLVDLSTKLMRELVGSTLPTKEKP